MIMHTFYTPHCAASPEDRKELFKRYQLKMTALKGSKGKSFAPQKLMKVYFHLLMCQCHNISLGMQIQVGGMIFNDKLCKGVRKRYIPSAQTMTFPTDASYKMVIEKGRRFFFPDELDDDDCFGLADTGGMPYKIQNKVDWVLSVRLKQPPSKLGVYILYWAKVLYYNNIVFSGG